MLLTEKISAVIIHSLLKVFPALWLPGACKTIQHNRAQYNTVQQYNATQQYNTVQHSNTTQYNTTIQLNTTLQYYGIQGMQHNFIDRMDKLTVAVNKVKEQSINILFYVCSHRGDIRQKQKHIIIIYTNFPTGL